uniref:NADP-dependent oxidoreductase domain-containing protein n=1 Tax=Gopherus evgoodei TaxID=1825980 RepID=A0A8C4W2R9_9SAUR
VSAGCHVMHLLVSLQSPPGAVQEAVEVALDAGYWHVDCAYFYQNEAEIGAAFQKKFGEGRLKRDELYVVSKVSPVFLPNRSPGLPILSKLPQDLGYWVFVCFSHGLSSWTHDTLDVDYVDTWRAMEKLVDEGLVKSVGVSNFNASQLERLLSVCRIKPAANQVELHPYLTQPELCGKMGLSVSSRWLCSSWPLRQPWILAHQLLSSLQVLIRFHIQRGIATILKSITPARIMENAEVTGMASEPGALFCSWRMAEVWCDAVPGKPITRVFWKPSERFLSWLQL